MLFQNARPGKSLSARELRAAGQQLAQAREALLQGDDGPVGTFAVGTGRGRFPNDKGHWFAVRITKGEGEKYEFEEIAYVYTDTVSQVQAVEGGRCAKLPNNPALPLGDETYTPGDIALARRSYRSPDAWELISTGGSEGRIFGRLLAKSGGTCPLYIYERVVPASGCGDNWESTGIEGEAYEVNGVHLPVPDDDEGQSGSGLLSGSGTNRGVVVELIPLSESGSGSGEGGLMVFIMEPRWEFVEPTSEPDGNGLMSGFELACDRGGCMNVEAILIIDINSLP